MLNNIVILKSRLKVTQSLEVAPLGRSHTSSYSSFVVTMAGCILYGFRNNARYWSKNTNFYTLPFNLHDHLEPLRIIFPKF